MPVPDLTACGLLPAGIHTCTPEEAEAAFARRKDEKKRGQLWDGFARYLDAVRQLGVVVAVYVDGGFTSDSQKPRDIDVVVEVPFPSPPLVPVLGRNEFDRNFVMQQYGLDLYVWWDGHPAPVNDLRLYFQYVKPKDALRRRLQPGEKKGILRIAL